MSEGLISLVADVGGTFARLALVADDTTEPTAIQIVRVSDYPTPEAAFEHYLADKQTDGLSSACLAVAGPVNNNRVQLTNTPWVIDGHALSRQFGWTSCSVINDFQAAALGVPDVPPERLVPIAPPGKSVTSTATPPTREPALVLGPGTGFGLAMLVPNDNGWIAEASEAGHVTFGATSEREWAVLQRLQETFGRVSVERLLSGPGLLNLYRAHAALDGRPADVHKPEQVTAAAMRHEDPVARAALDHFMSVLGRITGDALLMHGNARTVFLCGGLLPNLIDELRAGGFCAAMIDKGRMQSQVASTPVQLVTDPLVGLRGAARALRQT